MLNTFKTVSGFIGQAMERITGIRMTGDKPENVFNFLQLSQNIATSGQPNERQLASIISAGYRTVINLAPLSKLENALVAERSILDSMGVRYIHIPVDFENPTDQDYECFAQHMVDNANEQLWVHCAANMRVSAFMYRYRVCVLGVDKRVARSDLNKIWEPFGVWKKFVESEKSF